MSLGASIAATLFHHLGPSGEAKFFLNKGSNKRSKGHQYFCVQSVCMSIFTTAFLYKTVYIVVTIVPTKSDSDVNAK